MKRAADPHQAAGPHPDALDLGPLPSLLGYALRRAQLAVFADFHMVFAPLGLRPGVYGVLLLLRNNPGARASHVAETLGIRRANFTGLLAKLRAAGLVARGVDPRDRRAASLCLSPAGTALLARAETAIARHEGAWRERLGADDHARLLALLAKLLDGASHPGGPTQTRSSGGGSA